MEFVAKKFSIPIFSLFRFKIKMILITFRPILPLQKIAASSAVTDDVRKWVNHKIFNFSLYYSNA